MAIVLQSYEFIGASILTGLAVVVLTSLLYCCCRYWERGRHKKPTVYGKLREVTGHVGGKKKVFRVDPFLYSHVEFQRKFEDELAKMLYCLGTEVAMPTFETDASIKFTDMEGRECARRYSVDYRWLLKHFSVNARRYAFMLSGTTDPQLQDTITRCRDILPVEELLQRLQDERRPYSEEVVKSFERHVYEKCKELREVTERSCGGLLQEEVDSGNRIHVQQKIFEVMDEGMSLASVIMRILSKPPLAMKDHFNNLLVIRHVFAREFCPYIDSVRANRKVFSKLPHDVRSEVIMDMLSNVVNKADDEVLEMLAVSVLPRFAEQLPTH